MNFSVEEIRQLKTIAYYHGGRFGNFVKFFENIAGDYGNDSVSSKLIQAEVRRLLSYKNTMDNVFEKFKDVSTFQEVFDVITNKIINYFDKNIPRPELFVVDELPGLFVNRPWDAMSVDIKDEEEFGIKAGVYFKKKFLTHPYFECVTVHEAIHWIISYYSKTYFPLTNLIEEGLCDYFRCYFLHTMDILSPKIISNYLTFNRVLKAENSIPAQYYKFFNYVSAIAKYQGIDFLIDTIKAGRESVNSLKLEVDKHSKIISDIDLTVSIAQSSLVLQPTEYLILDFLISNDHSYFKDTTILKNLPVGIEQTSLSLVSLSNKGLIGEVADGYFQSFKQMPDSIKFNLDENN